MKSEILPCGCILYWDGEKVRITICERHQKETRKLKV